MTGFVGAQLIPGNMIIFSENTFGVIFMNLQCLSIYQRVKENLLGTQYCEVFHKDPLIDIPN